MKKILSDTEKGNFCRPNQVSRYTKLINMSRKKLTYLVLLILSCLFLTGLAAASETCEQAMTCCETTSVLSSSEQDLQPVSSLCCESTGANACSCSLQSEQPIHASHDFVFSSVYSDLEVPKFCLLVLAKEKTLAQDKPIWPPQEDTTWESATLPHCSFPNPPPAAA